MNISVLDKRIRSYCRENRISGVLRLTVKDKILYEGSYGYADEEAQTPFTAESMFTLYSMSKPICAIALMTLVDQGKVRLEDHPGVYVPEAAGLDKRVTINHLLHHTSGLPDFEQTPGLAETYAPGYPRFTRSHVAELHKYPMLFDPGTKDFYANINFVLCALIIENVSGMAYTDFMSQNIFAPLGMKTAVVDDETKFIPNRVTGYRLAENQLTPIPPNHNWMLGAGDIVGTVEDVYCLNKAIKHKLLLSQQAWEQVLTPDPLNNMGKGCRITRWHEKRRITHNGGAAGFRTLHIQLPEEDFDLIFLSNSGFGNARAELSEIVYEEYYGADQKTSDFVEMDKGYAKP